MIRAVMRSWFGDEYSPLLLLAVAVAGANVGLRSRRSRSLASLGVASWVAGLALFFVGLVGWTSGGAPAPGLGFLRYSIRFLVLFGLGQAILAALFCDALERARHRAWIVAIAACVVWLRAPLLVPALDRPPAMGEDRKVYERVRAIATEKGSGAVLELPWRDRSNREISPDAMLGATIHGMPLVNGYTGYFPAHLPVLRTGIADLPAARAADDLIEMTHVRWFLLRPAAQWSHGRVRERLLQVLDDRCGEAERWEVDGWTLHGCASAAWSHPTWFESLRAAPNPDVTSLGTPLRPLSREETSGEIRVVTAGATAPPGSIVRVSVAIANVGERDWPVSAIGGRWSRNVVQLVAEWKQRGDDAVDHSDRCALARDVPAGDTLQQECWLTAPRQRGAYDLVLHLEQNKNDAFARATPRVAQAVEVN